SALYVDAPLSIHRVLRDRLSFETVLLHKQCVNFALSHRASVLPKRAFEVVLPLLFSSLECATCVRATYGPSFATLPFSFVLARAVRSFVVTSHTDVLFRLFDRTVSFHFDGHPLSSSHPR